MLTNSQREHLVYTAIGQLVTLCVIGIWTYTYVVPGLNAIDDNITAANTSIEKYHKTEMDGLVFEDIVRLIGSKTEYAELLKIMNSDVAETNTILKKDSSVGDKSYLEWLKKSIWESTEEKEAISQYKIKLNSILPTLSPVSWNIEEDNITLKKYIRFIETQIVKKFNLDSNLVLWIQWISLWDDVWGTPSNIGTFDLQIGFKAKNRDIANFIQFINNTGNPDLLTNSGVLAKEDLPVVMSNPLITLMGFWLQDQLNEDDPNGENSGRVTLRFYVRGVSKDDVTYLRENIKMREDELGTSLKNSIDECKSQWPLCIEIKKQLDTFSKKYSEYKSWTSDKKPNTWDEVNQIYTLAQQASVLKSLEQEFEKIIVIPQK